MDSDKLLNLATSLGCLLAESGAEISRVEETGCCRPTKARTPRCLPSPAV